MACADDEEGYRYEPESVGAGIIRRSLLQPSENGDLVGVGGGPATDVERYHELAPPEGFPSCADCVFCWRRMRDLEVIAVFFQVGRWIWSDSMGVFIFVLDQAEFGDERAS